MRKLTLSELAEMTLLFVEPDAVYIRWELGIQVEPHLQRYMIPDILEEQELLELVEEARAPHHFNAEKKFRLSEFGKLKQKALSLFKQQIVTPIHIQGMPEYLESCYG